MPIIGFGAMYGGTDDKSPEFIARGVACVGWTPEEAPFTAEQLRSIRNGDIVFIKSFAPQIGLYIKAVGVVTDARPKEIAGLGQGVEVRWAWHGDPILVGKLEDRGDHMRRGTIYEELNHEVQGIVIDRLLS